MRRLNTYNTVPVQSLPGADVEAAKQARVVAFASPSAVKAWLACVGDQDSADVAIACIGAAWILIPAHIAHCKTALSTPSGIGTAFHVFFMSIDLTDSAPIPINCILGIDYEPAVAKQSRHCNIFRLWFDLDFKGWFLYCREHISQGSREVGSEAHLLPRQSWFGRLCGVHCGSPGSC